jgi:hypothetical protein
MKGFNAARGVAVAACVATGLLLTASAAFAASPIYLCINEKAGGAVKSGGAEGKCPLPTEKVKYTKVALPREESEQQTLLSILSHANYVESGVGGKPTIQFSGVNVQVVSGSGLTRGIINGEGNLVIGYDENAGKHQQNGSHNLVLGEEQTFTSYGGILGGRDNTVSGPFSSTSGGGATASGEASSVSGGVNNIASVRFASVSGGVSNNAIAEGASVSGGGFSTAEGRFSSIFGGKGLTTNKEYEAIP